MLVAAWVRGKLGSLLELDGLDAALGGAWVFLVSFVFALEAAVAEGIAETARLLKTSPSGDEVVGCD